MSREEELGQQLVEMLGETTGMLVRRLTGHTNWVLGVA